MNLWPHQRRGVDTAKARHDAGGGAPVITSPTGGGKTLMQLECIHWGEPTVLYTNRRMLLEQTAKRLTIEGIRFGVRAAGHLPDLGASVQLSSIQTEDERVYRSGKWTLHHARVVLVDECHNETGDRAQRIIKDHREAGATVIGFTATPLGIGHLYDELIVAGTNSELRQCGAHVMAQHFAPDEPDAKNLKTSTKTGEFTEGSVRKAIMTPTIFGRVFDHWKRLNPDRLPTLGFAPGVAESLWFAQQFYAKGIPSAHIDGSKIWIDGEFYPSDQEHRDYLAGLSQRGAVSVVWNRFVMREGIDWPWLAHGILATAFGSLTSYLQAGGRLIRNHDSLDSVTVQDHGGNWWRHGSLNSDREWRLDGEDRVVTSERHERIREKKEPEPIVCPKCNAVRLHGPQCGSCGHRSDARVRMVMQTDGTLRSVKGDIFRPRRTSSDPADVKLWKSCYFRAKNASKGMSFNQAAALFFRETGKWPDPLWPLMPKDSIDKFRRVSDVPFSSLHQGDSNGVQDNRRTVEV